MDARLLMDSPRDRMVTAAIQGMRRNGLAGAGINQVVAASGAPKGSLYHYFPGGKNQLAQEALERFGEERRAALMKLVQGAGDAPARLRRLFASLAKSLEKEDYAFGCAVAGVALDLQADSAPLGAVCTAQLDLWTEALAPAFDPLPPARRQAWARLTITTFEGALMQARARRSREPLLEAGELLAEAVRHEISLA
ncbi:TetR/AcrR family transcriptional regulator [Caenimonas sedimenti]|uniref:TetR/AcrR family transcriptional regulator n=1 Tax=Caenimonas sedimenti TaxID=2596921 RepID=A0A562ZR58_9BURK|nr:TetR/AcrR family transcriptional regulator [Caenimonas sedimenti]TWO70785.1 TetR/AcrR family transcriptional regulator [Caenimonas sedimenti]